MLKYEDVITSVIIATIFAWGARGEKSMLQGLVEQQQGDNFEDGPDIRRFFKLFTLLWASYFLLKAIVYLWLGEILPMEEALTVRPVIGMVSLGAMVLLSLKCDSVRRTLCPWTMELFKDWKQFIFLALPGVVMLCSVRRVFACVLLL